MAGHEVTHIYGQAATIYNALVGEGYDLHLFDKDMEVHFVRD